MVIVLPCTDMLWTNVTKIKVGYYWVLAQYIRTMENWVFPSSEVTTLKMELFQLKNFVHARVHGVTWWEKPVFHGARELGQNPGIANLYFSNVVMY